MLTAILVVFFLSLAAHGVEGGECCDEYTDRYGSTHDAQYCSFYCCGGTINIFSSSRSLYCCSSYSDRAPSYDRTDSCNWWTNNSSWAIALIVIGNLAIVAGCITCCVCCVKGCCGQNRTGTVVVQPQQSGGGVTMMSQMNQMSQNQSAQYPPSNYGYPPPQYPGAQPTTGSYANPPPQYPMAQPTTDNYGIPPPQYPGPQYPSGSNSHQAPPVSEKYPA